MPDGIMFYITSASVEHMVNDALYKTHGKLKLSDIPHIDEYFLTAGKPTIENNVKTNNKNIHYRKYPFLLNGHSLCIVIKDEKQKNGKHRVVLHSITEQKRLQKQPKLSLSGQL